MKKVKNIQSEKNATAEQKRAAELIATQRKSIAMLKHVEDRVNDLPFEIIMTNLEEKGFYVIDNFLEDDSYITSMQNEAIDIHTEKAKLQLIPSPDLGVASGEFGGQLKGGSDYADSPRCTEFVVSLTRHLCPNLGKILEDSKGISLDETVSMSSVKTFDRKAQRSALTLMTGSSDDKMIEECIDSSGSSRSFGLITDGNDSDLRKVTCYYFLTPNHWTDKCGGSIVLKNGINSEENCITANRNRLVIFFSDSTQFKELPWFGVNGMDYGSCIITNLIRKAA